MVINKYIMDIIIKYIENKIEDTSSRIECTINPGIKMNGYGRIEAFKEVIDYLKLLEKNIK